jgi:HD-GYP domain-containing protein (c-di-GMP phosphodiesterase class II)
MENFLVEDTLTKKVAPIRMFDILMCFSNAIDLVDPEVSGHHIRVAYISLKIAKEYGLDKKSRDKLVMAACIHDIGSIGLKENHELLNSNRRHAEIGYYHTMQSKIFSRISDIIRYHHKEWVYEKIDIPIESQILHLANKIDACIEKNKYILCQVENIINIIKAKSGIDFNPKIVDSFIRLSEKESFWLYLVSENLSYILNIESRLPRANFSIEDYRELAMWFTYFIDFKSNFTTIHSIGVAESAKIIATKMNLSKKDIQLIEIAGFVHDLGKLAVQNNILEKKGKLSADEFSIIKSHTFYTFNILNSIRQFRLLAKYASYHHEHLDGTGYPFHLKANDIPIGSRILAVADIFTAVAEDRPYRKGMNKDEIIELLNKKGDDKHLDSQIVRITLENFDEIRNKMKKVQELRNEKSKEFWSNLDL